MTKALRAAWEIVVLAILFTAALVAISAAVVGQIPNANDALAGIEVGRKTTYLNTETVPAGHIVFMRGTKAEATPTSIIKATNIPEPVKYSYLSVVRISGSVPGGLQRGSGTYLGDGLILTNRHVVSGAGNFYVTLKDGRSTPATLQRVSGTSADLAILEVKNLDHILKPVPVAMRDVRPGETVYPSGFDNGNLDWHTIWPSRVYNFFSDGDWEAKGLSQRSGSISGNSGGPVFNDRGELIAPLWGTNGNPSSGVGSTMAVCFRSTRFFLFPWRARIMRAIRPRWNYQPIIINIGGGEQFEQQPIQPPTQQPQGYLIEGKLIPLRSANKTDNVAIVPLENQTQCGPSYGGGQIISGGYGYQQCPPPSQPYGNPYGGSPYGNGGGAERPILQPDDIPEFQPGPSNEPQELELDYDKLAEALLPMMAGDARFKGADGRDGNDGRDGAPGQVTQSQLTAMSAALLEQMAIDPRFKGPQGNQGEITPEQVAELTEEIKRGLSRRVLVVDDEQQKVLSDETYAQDKPIILDLTKLVRQASVKGGSR